MFGFRKRRRERLRAAPFPPQWRAIIEGNFELFGRLGEADRAELLGHVAVFLDEKKFEGCGGLEITDVVRVTIAAPACLLLLHHEPCDYYPELSSIVVYPHAYVARVVQRGPDGVVHEFDSARLGESWTRGVVVLSWDDVLAAGHDVHHAHNVVLHEFAHQLDQENGAVDGAPRLERRGLYAAWARILSGEFEALRRAAARGHSTDIDPYGATNPAEFFAVATETFFERPELLRERHRGLYDELAMFYRQDPASFAPARHGRAPARPDVSSLAPR